MTGAKNKESHLPEALLTRAGELISGLMGLHFPKARRKDLERGLRAVSLELGFENPEACTRWLISSTLSKSQIEILAGHLTVGETYFFRDKRTFTFLEEKCLPELIELRRTTGKHLRIWSAGCCTGEEPYSLAILLHKILGDTKDWNITLLATDINPLFLRKASAGIYGEWSFRDTPEWVRENYFTRKNKKQFELLPEIRKRVSFTYHNLAENAYPSLLTNTNALDLILCRNVFMYLTPDHQSRVTGKLRRCLIEGGWLITGPSETTEALSSEFVGVEFQGATFYKRRFMIDDCRLSIEKQPPSPSFQSSIINQKSSLQDSSSINQQSSITPKGLFSKKQIIFNPLDFQSSIDNHQSSIQMARTAADRGSLPEALGYCEKAMAVDRFDPYLYYLRASILQEQGRLQEAAADLGKALYLDQDFIPAHILLGNLTLRQGNRRGSSRHFRNALRLLDLRPIEEVMPEAEGLTAGRLREIIRSTMWD